MIDRERSRLQRIRRLVDYRILQGCTQVGLAIRQKQRLVCLYQKQVLVFCPQLLGHRPDGPYVLAFIVAGDPALRNERLRSPKRWRWLSVADMWGLSNMDGPWVSAPGQTRPGLENVTVELECA